MLKKKITNCRKQSSCRETYTPSLVKNLSAFYRTRNFITACTTAPNLSYIKTMYNLPYWFRISFLTVSTLNLVSSSLLTMRDTRPAHLILFDLITWKISGDDCKLCMSLLWNIFLVSCNFSVLVSNMFIKTLLENPQPIPAPQYDRPRLTTIKESKIVILCTLISTLLDSKGKTR